MFAVEVYVHWGFLVPASILIAHEYGRISLGKHGEGDFVFGSSPIESVQYSLQQRRITRTA